MRKVLWLVIAGSLIIVTVCAVGRLRFSRSNVSSATPQPVPDSLVLASVRTRVYRVSTAGLTQLPVTVDSASNATRPYGPVISPDQRWIAFSKSHDLWIYDVASGEQYQATHLGQPETSKLLSVDVLSLGWSADSRQFLLQVTPGLELCDECPEQHQPAAAQYGFYIYAPAGKLATPVRLPEKFEFRAWLPDGRFLGIVGRETACVNGSISNCGTLAIVQEGAAEPQVIEGFNGLHADLSISPDGKLAVTSDPDNGDDREGQSQIVRIDLAGGRAHWLTPVGERGEYQSPKFSPDGKHVAWLWFARQPSARSLMVVDGNSIFSCGEIGFDFHWLDSQRVGVECRKSMSVLDLTGKPLMHAAMPPISGATR
jgi:hypothetical protein